ncbi:MAG: hypothetical protein [Microviridae sp.]|nr:MAG: hypothetical protein [Microviridae sp.]
MTHVILLFLLIKELHHETPQNVQVSVAPVFYQGRVVFPQEKLLHQSDARRHSPLSDAMLQTPSGLSGRIDKPQDGETPSCLHD